MSRDEHFEKRLMNTCIPAIISRGEINLDGFFFFFFFNSVLEGRRLFVADFFPEA